MGRTVRGIWLLAGVLAVSSALALAQTTTAPSRRDRVVRTREEHARQLAEEIRKRQIERISDYYLRMFGEHLRSPDEIERCMAVLNLGRIADPQMTDKLLETLQRDRASMVRAFAHEVLHAQNDRLTDKQRDIWLAEGRELIRRNALHGKLRLAVARSLGNQPPDARARRTFILLAHRCDLSEPGDRAVLEAMRDVVGTWQDVNIVRLLMHKLADKDAWPVANFLLGGLSREIADSAASPKTVSRLVRTPSGYRRVTQTSAAPDELRRKWGAFLRGNRLEPPKPEAYTPYTGTSKLIAGPEVIDNPKDPKWLKDLEIPRLNVGQLDLSIALDTTGSMSWAIQWIRGDLVKIMDALHAFSREPRIGMVIYRDEGDEYVTQRLNLTGNAAFLRKTMMKVNAGGGGDYPEAVLQALTESVQRQNWSRSQHAKKVVLLVGDAPPHKEHMPQLEKLVKAAVAKKFRFYCVKVTSARRRIPSSTTTSAPASTPPRPTLARFSVEAAFDQIAEWGNGKSVFVSRSRAGMASATEQADPEEESPYRTVVEAILYDLVSEEYRDRLKPFVTLLLENLDARDGSARR